MGAQPVELQREIEQQRRQVGEKLARLRNRLQPDIQEAQSAAKRQAARARKRALRGFVFTAGALGLAVALGKGYSAWRRGRSRKQ
jgi:type VI protein secretion system component VasF